MKSASPLKWFQRLRGAAFDDEAAPAAASPPSSQAAWPRRVSNPETAFAFDLYAALRGTPGNLFFSPYSLYASLAMAYEGARGQTQAQMAKVLHFAGRPVEMSGRWGRLRKQIAEAATVSSAELRIANGLWAHSGHPFLPDYLQMARGAYEARLEQADFPTAAEGARAEINHWVAEQTAGRVQDLIPPGGLTPDTLLVLANAIYFKAGWLKPFKEEDTQRKPFYQADGSQAEVALMHQVNHLKYMGTESFQAVELPYSGARLAMVVLLPRERGGCAGLEQSLTVPFLAQILSAMRPQRVEVFLPRFRADFKAELASVVAGMGAPDAFSQKEADFSGMDGKRLVYLSRVCHKAWVETQEEGTEAAAATVMAARPAGGLKRPPPPVFRADHPFVFLIREVMTGTVLFLGRVSQI